MFWTKHGNSQILDFIFTTFQFFLQWWCSAKRFLLSLYIYNINSLLIYSNQNCIIYFLSRFFSSVRNHWISLRYTIYCCCTFIATINYSNHLTVKIRTDLCSLPESAAGKLVYINYITAIIVITILKYLQLLY